MTDKQEWHVHELARRLNVNPRSVTRYLKENGIPTRKEGLYRRVEHRHVAHLIDMADKHPLTVQDVQERLRLSYPTVMRRLKAGAIRGIKFFQQWRFSNEALAAYIESTKDSPT